MNYVTIYELTDIEGNMMNIIPITLFVIIGLFILFFAKRFLETGTFRQRIMLFFGFILTLISSIILITFLIKIPKIISQDRELKTVIENKSYLKVEGLTENYSLKNINGSNFESFSVKGILFEYSDNVNNNGFHKTSKNSGPISENGQQVRIGYMTIDNENLILKLEIDNQ